LSRGRALETGIVAERAATSIGTAADFIAPPDGSALGPGPSLIAILCGVPAMVWISCLKLLTTVVLLRITWLFTSKVDGRTRSRKCPSSTKPK
jgi:hypothetical protein